MIRKYFDKYKVNLLVCLGIACFTVLPYFSQYIYNAHDLQFHLSRIEGVYHTLLDHQFPMAVYPNKNFGYGYASPLFYSDIFLIIPSLLVHLCHVPLVTMFEILVFVSVYLAALHMSITLEHILHRKDCALLTAFVYVTANYFVTDIFIRAALGEIFALGVLPFLLYVIYDLLVLKKDNWLALAAVFALLVHSHLITAAMATVILILSVLINIKTVITTPKIMTTLVKAAALGLGLTAVFFFPMFEQYVSQDLIVHHIGSDMLQQYMVPLKDLFGDFFADHSLQWRNSRGVDRADTLKNLGTLAGILPFGYLFVKKNKYITQVFVMFVLVLLCSTPVLPIYRIPFISFMQFPSRLYTPGLVGASLIICWILTGISKKSAKILAACILVFTGWNLSYLFSCINDPVQLKVIDRSATAEELFTERKYANVIIAESRWNWEELSFGEYLPYADAYYYDYYNVGTELDDLSYGHLGIPYERKGTTLKFTSSFTEDTWVLIPMTWYKGYRIRELDENWVTVKYPYISQHTYSGRIQLKAEAGTHTYVIEYAGTKIQKISAAISVLSLAVLLYVLIRKH